MPQPMEPDGRPARVSAIVVLGSQEPLVDSAMAARERRAPRIGLENARLPKGLAIDPAFNAVPLGSTRHDILQAAVQPNLSKNFVVRVYLDVADSTNAPEKIGGLTVFANPVISPFLTCGGDPPLGATSHVATNLKSATLAAGGLDGSGVAIAIVDTGINIPHLTGKLGRVPRFDVANSWSPAGVAAAPGYHAVHHGTMCAYDALIAAPNATLLDYPVLPLVGGSLASGTIATAVRAFADLMANWSVAFAPGGAAKYKALVVNNSWGVYHPSNDFPPGHRGRYIDNSSHPSISRYRPLREPAPTSYLRPVIAGPNVPRPFVWDGRRVPLWARMHIMKY